jgi:hypothetical protein
LSFILLLFPISKADIENLREYVQEGMQTIHEFLGKFQSIEIPDIDLKQFTTMINERLEERDSQEKNIVSKYEEKINTVKTEITLVNDNLLKKIDDNNLNSKKTAEIVNRLGNELKALESKLFVNKE